MTISNISYLFLYSDIFFLVDCIYKIRNLYLYLKLKK